MGISHLIYGVIFCLWTCSYLVFQNTIFFYRKLELYKIKEFGTWKTLQEKKTFGEKLKILKAN